MIPPVPLSLKEIGVYHGMSRTKDGEYNLSFETALWYELGKKTSAIFHRRAGEPIYAFSSVFAPTRLDTEIVHHWYYFDEGKGNWVSSNLVNFPISGGRDGGYRGYSVKENTLPGKWRVDVETPRGQIIGRFGFEVVDIAETPLITTETR